MAIIKRGGLKMHLSCLMNAVTSSPPAVRVGVTVFVTVLMFVLLVYAGTSIGRAMYHFTH